MIEAEKLTAEGDKLTLTIAISYGGRQEIVAAAKRLASAVAEGRLSAEKIDEAAFTDGLATNGMPDPDLLIRTSGEKRISNFLLWQTAYSELVFVEKHWPDFGKDDLADAIAEFMRRDRRYGATAESR